MNTLHLGRSLGDVNTPSFQRHYQLRLAQSLDHNENVTFSFFQAPRPSTTISDAEPVIKPVAHQAGTNCLTISSQQGRFLASGGADSTIRLWDLESQSPSTTTASSELTNYQPVATLTRANQSSHSHALTSISIYPFDPTPSTLLTTSHDKTLLLSQITPTGLTPLHKFNLDFTPYTHALSPVPNSSSLVAVGTNHPAIRLLDLRSGLSTHSLPGHNAAIHAVTFSPRHTHTHILISGGADGRILLFDIRRANPAFASLDLDDAVGFPTSTSTSTSTLLHNPTSSRPTTKHLDFTAQAHTGPVTGLTIPPSDPTKLLSAGHDQRIRLWDLNTGRNELVHFGPRIRNSRTGNLTPTITPNGTGKPGRELVFWPNDDGRGEVHVHSMREGNLIQVLKTKGVDRSNTGSSNSKVGKLTSGGRVNAVVFRANADAGTGLEMYTAHGDGRVCAWFPRPDAGKGDVEDDDDGDIHEVDESIQASAERNAVLTAEQSKKKRKRDLISDLVEGLTKKPVTFS